MAAKSGNLCVPEVDRAGFFRMAEAKQKINPAQVALLEELERSGPRTGREFGYGHQYDHFSFCRALIVAAS